MAGSDEEGDDEQPRMLYMGQHSHTAKCVNGLKVGMLAKDQGHEVPHVTSLKISNVGLEGHVPLCVNGLRNGFRANIPLHPFL